MIMIKPTVGRIVHFRAHGPHSPLQAAIIAAVFNDRLVTLAAFSPNGKAEAHEMVTLLQGDDAAPLFGPYAQWMDYQKGQAARTEQLEASMGRAVRETSQSLRAPAGKAPSVTPADLDREIAAGEVLYTRIDGTLITHCTIKLVNGFSVTGESACVSAANFNEAKGREIAFANAREKLWPLLGFRLADCLHDDRLRADPATAPNFRPSVTDEMVGRFLGWRVPQDFHPDCAVTFDRERLHPSSWPTGTNLLSATQAQAMLEHVLGGK